MSKPETNQEPKASLSTLSAEDRAALIAEVKAAIAPEIEASLEAKYAASAKVSSNAELVAALRESKKPAPPVENINTNPNFKGMTEVVSLRNFRLPTTKGHVVTFEARVPKYIPDVILADAMEKGCTPTSELDMAMFEGSKAKARVQFSGALRASLLALYIVEFVENNQQKDFDGAGEVKHSVLSEAVGFDVHHEEAQKAFRAVMGAQKAGEDLDIHKDAPLVKQIIEASNKQDLMELVPHTKLKPDQAKGMQTRDLRKAMLASFSGLTNE